MPVCDTCSRIRRHCVGCGKDKYATTRTGYGHLCETCWQKNPVSFNPCRLCGTVEYLHSYGRCHSCVRDRQALDALSHDGALRPELDPVRKVPVAGGAKARLKWLAQNSARTILDALADATCPLTHEGLDGLLPNKSVAFLRTALVAVGVLPPRDERFAALERWIATTTEIIPDDGERQLVRRFATRHHLRRLRRETRHRPVTASQAGAVRAIVRSAVRLLSWLREHATELGLCSQVHLDEWVADGTTTRYNSRGFVEWYRRNRHIGKNLEIPSRVNLSHVRRTDEDERWAVSRRLIHDDGLAIEDRFAGLLVLLFAQPLTVVSRLPVTAVIIDGPQTSLSLGDTPVLLPDPLDKIARHRRRTALGTSTDSPWLCPGAFTGHHLTDFHLRTRLKRLGIYSRPGRTSALMGLSTQLPAAVLTKLLGISPETATAWTRTGGQWARYAADLSERGSTGAQAPVS